MNTGKLKGVKKVIEDRQAKAGIIPARLKDAPEWERALYKIVNTKLGEKPPTPSMVQLGQELKKTREAKNWGLRKAAEVAGCSYAYLSRVENGSVPKLSVDFLGKLASAYGCTLEVKLVRKYRAED